MYGLIHRHEGKMCMCGVEGRLLCEQGDSQEWRAGYYESRVTHNSGGQVIMRAG